MNLFFDFVFLADTATNTVNNASSKNWPDMLGLIGQFFLLIVVFCFVLFLAYYTTKFVGKAGQLRNRGKHISIIEAASVGLQNTIQLVKVGEKYYLIGVSKEGVRYLTEVEGEFADLPEKNNFANIPFEAHLRKMFDKNAKKDNKEDSPDKTLDL